MYNFQMTMITKTIIVKGTLVDSIDFIALPICYDSTMREQTRKMSNTYEYFCTSELSF